MGATAHPETVSGEIQQRDCPGISPVFPIKSDSTDTQILIANIQNFFKVTQRGRFVLRHFAKSDAKRNDPFASHQISFSKYRDVGVREGKRTFQVVLH